MDKKIIPNYKDLMMPLLEFAADGKKLIELYKKIVLTAILAIATTTVAMADIYDYGSGVAFRVTSSSPAEVEVTRLYHSLYSGNINIPSSVVFYGVNYRVTSIGDRAFSWCRSLTSVNIPNSVTSIGNEAFYMCSSLTSINIPNSVTSIGGEAFRECSSLTSINIPSSVTSIGIGAFYMCSSLTSISIPNSVTEIGNEAFRGCSSLTSINIPNSVTSIRYGTFSGCSNLPSISIPNSVTEIGNEAFSGCWSLISIDIPNSVTEIGKGAFSRCRSLPSINIPNSVTSIEDETFFGCSSLISIDIPNSVTSIEDEAFSVCDSLTTVNIGNSVTSIGDKAFYACWNLTSINIPNSVTEIGEWAFFSCARLKSIDIPNAVIGDYAFISCDSLKSVNIGNSVTSIGDGAFRWCSSLTTVDIGNSVTSIGNEAFFGCSSLKSVDIPNSVTSIGSEAFFGCSSLISIDIPNSVTSIGKGAFISCDSLKSVNIGNSVTEIGDYVFSGCHSLRKINIDVINPASINLGQNIFDGIPKGNSANVCVLLVPHGSVPAYSNAPQWRDFILHILEQNTATIIYDQTARYGTLAILNATDDSNIPSGIPIADGTVIKILPTPYNGYHLDSIKVNGAVVENNSTVTITQPTIVEAFFSLNKYGIEYTHTTGGTLDILIVDGVVIINDDDDSNINILPSGSQVGHGTVIKIVPTPDNGYHLDSIKVNGDIVTYDIVFVSQPTTIEAFFSNKYGIQCIHTTGGTLDILNATDDSNIPSGSPVEDGTIIKVVATPDNGYRLDSIKVNGTITANNSTVTITQHTTIEAFFSLNKYVIEYTHTTGGTLDILNVTYFSNIPRGSQVEHGIVIYIVATPDNGYRLDSIKVNGTITANNSTVTITQHTTIEAFFSFSKHEIGYVYTTGGTLAVLKAADGSNIPDNSQVEHGTVINIVATPDNGYRLDSIRVNGTVLANDSTVVISQNTTIETYFHLIQYGIQYRHTTGGTLTIINTADSSNIASGSLIEHGTVIRIVATPDNGYRLATITVNGETFTDTHKVNGYTYIEARFVPVTGIDHSDYTALSIYPTPAGEYITVATEVGSSPVSVTVTDLSGRTVATAIATGSKTEINISHLSAGTYIVRVGNKAGKVVKR